MYIVAVRVRFWSQLLEFRQNFTVTQFVPLPWLALAGALF